MSNHLVIQMDFPFAFLLNDDLNRRNRTELFGGRLSPEEYAVFQKEKLILTRKTCQTGKSDIKKKLKLTKLKNTD